MLYRIDDRGNNVVLRITEEKGDEIMNVDSGNGSSSNNNRELVKRNTVLRDGQAYHQVTVNNLSNNPLIYSNQFGKDYATSITIEMPANQNLTPIEIGGFETFLDNVRSRIAFDDEGKVDIEKSIDQVPFALERNKVLTLLGYNPHTKKTQVKTIVNKSGEDQLVKVKTNEPVSTGPSKWETLAKAVNIVSNLTDIGVGVYNSYGGSTPAITYDVPEPANLIPYTDTSNLLTYTPSDSRAGESYLLIDMEDGNTFETNSWDIPYLNNF